MSILEKFTKQPEEVQDYDISFVDWLAGFSDTGVSHVVTIDAGITMISSVLNAGIVKVWISGGVSGVSYKVTATLTTVGSGGIARVKQAEILIKVKEV